MWPSRLAVGASGDRACRRLHRGRTGDRRPAGDPGAAAWRDRRSSVGECARTGRGARRIGDRAAGSSPRTHCATASRRCWHRRTCWPTRRGRRAASRGRMPRHGSPIWSRTSCARRHGHESACRFPSAPSISSASAASACPASPRCCTTSATRCRAATSPIPPMSAGCARPAFRSPSAMTRPISATPRSSSCRPR